MTKYIRLTWERNQEGTTDKYCIYRSSALPVDRTSIKVCEVDHPTQVNPIAHKETIPPSKEGVYALQHKSVIKDSLVVTSNGYKVDGEYDEEENTFKPFVRTGDLDVSYLFDGVTVVDKEGEGKRFAPPAIDNNSVIPPENVQLKTDQATGEIIVSFKKPVSEGKVVFYAVESVGGESRSVLSDPIRVLIKEDVVSYKIQSSYRGGEWVDEGRFANELWKKVVAKEPPHPVSPLELTKTNGNVRISWSLSTLSPPVNNGPALRLSSVSSNGEESTYSRPVGPISVSASPSKIIIKKITKPSKEEKTVAEMEYGEFSSYIDPKITPGEHTYIVYVKDAAGNLSMGKTNTIKV